MNTLTVKTIVDVDEIKITYIGLAEKYLYCVHDRLSRRLLKCESEYLAANNAHNSGLLQSINKQTTDYNVIKSIMETCWIGKVTQEEIGE